MYIFPIQIIYIYISHIYIFPIQIIYIYITYMCGICESQSFKLFAFLPFPYHPKITERQERKREELSLGLIS